MNEWYTSILCLWLWQKSSLSLERRSIPKCSCLLQYNSCTEFNTPHKSKHIIHFSVHLLPLWFEMTLWIPGGATVVKERTQPEFITRTGERYQYAHKFQINGGIVMVQGKYWQLGVGIQLAIHVGADSDALDWVSMLAVYWLARYFGILWDSWLNSVFASHVF